MLIGISPLFQTISLSFVLTISQSLQNAFSYAHLQFYHIQNPQTQYWNSMIKRFAYSRNALQAILYYNQMVRTSVSRPNSATFSFLLKACEKVKYNGKCGEAHGSIIRIGYESDVVVCTNLVRSYVANGSIGMARELFDGMSQRDLVCWNSMISCYAQAGFHCEALKLYGQIRVANVGFDGFSVVSLLSSCAHVGALSIGVMLHELVIEKGLLDNVHVGNSLIDMYAKCGSLDGAFSVFSRMRKKDVYTWNSLIVGYGVHGRGREAICCFGKMLMEGYQPDSITFLGLLCGCSHQGLLEEGVEHFNMMISRYNVNPEVKHYGCMVDLFGRAGKLDMALEIIEDSPFQDNSILWRTLLGSCKTYKDVEKGEIAMKRLVQLGKLGAGDCILLARIYAEKNDLQGIKRVRKLIKDEGIKTTPGWSWIEVDNEIHRFVVDDMSHPDSEEIYHKLREVIDRVTLSGYVGVSKEHCQDTSVSYHSEKIAMAFGLARISNRNSALRIVKNLRICRDCHLFTQFVSKAYSREIVVRDRVRFHHFRDGLCSCNDYW